MSDRAAVEAPAESVSVLALVVRWVVTSHLVALTVQLSTAVVYAAGWFDLVRVHMANARLVLASSILQGAIVVCLPAARISRSSRGMAVTIIAGAAAQLHLGVSKGLGTHVTVALLVWAFSLALFINVWAPAWKGNTRA